jgi:hypothetical protein
MQQPPSLTVSTAHRRRTVAAGWGDALPLLYCAREALAEKAIAGTNGGASVNMLREQSLAQRGPESMSARNYRERRGMSSGFISR